METFSAEDYRAATGRLFAAFEERERVDLAPGEKGKVGLKIYTNSGPGLATPTALVRAVIAELEERGFAPEDIFLVDQSLHKLRRSGFLTELGEEEAAFEGHPVLILESGDHYDEAWFYESPLPPRRGGSPGGLGEFRYEAGTADRRSYLAEPLLFDVDFWINLPVYTDHPVLGINGALVNATLWNASNSARFFQSEAIGAAAVAEMAAIPELAEGWIFSVASLERYQFLGGPEFRSLYTASEPLLLLGADPLALDTRMYRTINERREEHRFEPLATGRVLLDNARLLRGLPATSGGEAGEKQEEPLENSLK